MPQLQSLHLVQLMCIYLINDVSTLTFTPLLLTSDAVYLSQGSIFSGIRSRSRFYRPSFMMQAASTASVKICQPSSEITWARSSLHPTPPLAGSILPWAVVATHFRILRHQERWSLIVQPSHLCVIFRSEVGMGWEWGEIGRS